MEETVEVPCVVCCGTVKIFPKKVTAVKKNEDYRVFKWFLRNFQNPPGQHLFSTKFSKGGEEGTQGWDGERGVSEPLQFCGNCRDPIMEWIGEQKSLPSTTMRNRRGGESGLGGRDEGWRNVRISLWKVGLMGGMGGILM